MLAMYRIDLDRNESRLLDLGVAIQSRIRDELPSAYRALMDRYTERVAGVPNAGDSTESRPGYIRVKYKYKDLLSKLLEANLGINKPLT